MKTNALVAFGLALVVLSTGCVSAQHKLSSTAWGPPSDRAVRTAQAEKHPVVIAFDADWCMQTHNAKNYFDSREGRRLLASTGARAFRVDCTAATPECKDLMKHYGAKTIPSYVVIRPGTSEPTLLDGGELTPDSLRDALAMSHKPSDRRE